MKNKIMHKIYIQLNSSKEVEEFVNICSKVPEDVILRGKDEYGFEWSLNAKSLLCSLVANVKIQQHREHTAHDVDWNTIYVECERDIYNLISKFAK